MFLETRLIPFLQEHFGTLGLVAGVLILLGIRFLPTWWSNLKEKRLEALREKLAEKQETTNREHELLARIDKKDAVLEKLTGNHIQHLEVQLAASREFYSEAVKALTALMAAQEGSIAILREVKEEAQNIKEDTAFLKGKLS